ncbi:hypothetical protein SSX86_003217 [Deinandra increscens subsp. villosa]|uniref:SWIM-type domain-containing protein n=1 Tax=Deinandra increscens subsp. villosa TaxID=3103831 RepID=A0AAP0DKW8_9ASTR
MEVATYMNWRSKDLGDVRAINHNLTDQDEVFIAGFVSTYDFDGEANNGEHGNAEAETDHADGMDEGEGNVEAESDHAHGEDEGEGDDEDGESDEYEDGEDEGEAEVGTDDEGEDSDFIVDEDNVIEDVAVDMEEFRVHVDVNIGEEDNDVSENEETAEIDLEDFDSHGSEEDTPLGRGIKKLNKRQSNWKADYTAPFYVGQTILSKDEINDTVIRTAVESRRQLAFVKNDTVRMRVVCYGHNPNNVCKKTNEPGESSSGPTNLKTLKGVGKGELTIQPKKKRFPTPTCPWSLQISRKSSDTVWCVKVFNAEHKCLTTRNVKLYTATAIAKEIQPIVEANPTIPLKYLQHQLQGLHQLHVSTAKLFRAKTMASKKIHGDYTAQYSILREYCEELIRSNPGTSVKIDVESECNPASPTRQFKRIYICFAALREGFKACGRDLLGLDGCFMKGPFPGQVLTAVGVDSNNGIYPLAYAIVEAETLLSWTWFLECIGQDLDLEANSNFTFISDRQKGLIPALQKVFPAAEHRFCLRHIHQNMKSKWRGDVLKDLLWKCATDTTVPSFERRMEAVRKQDADLHQWLKEIPAKHWSRSQFSERPKSDLLLNNLCEVFNKQLVGGRDKPIITCLEYIREYLMKRIALVHKKIAKADGPLTPVATKTFNLIKNLANEYTVIVAGFNKYQVNGSWGDQVAVDLDRKFCSCRRWQLSGMPCKHAVACIWDYGKDHPDDEVPEKWVDKAYWLDTWRTVYQHTLEPINGRSEWMTSRCPTKLTPPKHHTQVGRPKKKRKKSAVELAEGVCKEGKLARKGNTVTCGKCKKQGHNSRSCKGQGSSTAGGSSQQVPTDGV